MGTTIAVEYAALKASNLIAQDAIGKLTKLGATDGRAAELERLALACRISEHIIRTITAYSGFAEVDKWLGAYFAKPGREDLPLGEVEELIRTEKLMPLEKIMLVHGISPSRYQHDLAENPVRFWTFIRSNEEYLLRGAEDGSKNQLSLIGRNGENLDDLYERAKTHRLTSEVSAFINAYPQIKLLISLKKRELNICHATHDFPIYLFKGREELLAQQLQGKPEVAKEIAALAASKASLEQTLAELRVETGKLMAQRESLKPEVKALNEQKEKVLATTKGLQETNAVLTDKINAKRLAMGESPLPPGS